MTKNHLVILPGCHLATFDFPSFVTFRTIWKIFPDFRLFNNSTLRGGAAKESFVRRRKQEGAVEDECLNIETFTLNISHPAAFGFPLSALISLSTIGLCVAQQAWC